MRRMVSVSRSPVFVEMSPRAGAALPFGNVTVALVFVGPVRRDRSFRNSVGGRGDGDSG